MRQYWWVSQLLRLSAAMALAGLATASCSLASGPERPKGVQFRHYVVMPFYSINNCTEVGRPTTDEDCVVYLRSRYFNIFDGQSHDKDYLQHLYFFRESSGSTHIGAVGGYHRVYSIELLSLGKKGYDEELKFPYDFSSGSSSHPIEVGDVFIFRYSEHNNRDHIFGKLRIDGISEDGITFDYLYQPNGSGDLGGYPLPSNATPSPSTK